MSTWRAVLPSIALVLALLPGLTYAAELRQGSNADVGPTETINDDLYVAAGSVNIRGTVNGDLVVAGGNIAVDGPINGDLIATGGTVTVSREDARPQGIKLR